MPNLPAHPRTLSIVIPVYNERSTIEKVIGRVRAVELDGWRKEIVVVDDASRDGSADILKGLSGIRCFFHGKNQGKGGALKTGLARASGDVILIQDADLEYDPENYKALLEPILSGRGEFVMGTRFHAHGPRFLTRDRAPFFSHFIGNKIIIALTNILYGQRKTDYESCYKVFTRSVLESVAVESSGFEFDNELVCKALRRGYEIIEVPIRYKPRLYSQGKKIKWWHGMAMVWTIVKWRLLPF